MIALLLAVLVQSPAAVERAAQTISPDAISRRIHIIADDSMKGRDTPSPELDEVAAYIAGEYQRLGLKPGGDRGTFIQHYALNGARILGDSSVAFLHGGPGATLKYGADFIFADNMFASGDYAGELVLVEGPLTAPTADTAGLAGKMIVLAAPRVRGPIIQRIMSWKPAGVVVVSNAADSNWTRLANGSRQIRPQDPSRQVGPIRLVIRAAAILPAVAGLESELGGAAAVTTFQVKPLDGVLLHVHARIEPAGRNFAPNVVGILEGSDPALRNQYVVFSAHMDHIGVAGPNGTGACQARGADSICNGADDDGSGTAAVIEIAEAFAGLASRPKRSIIVLNVSGEEKGLWGSRYFADHPPVPITSIVADLNIDMIGRNWRDTIVAIGEQHSDLGATLNRVAAAHPELDMRPIDDIWPTEDFYHRSDHFNFARKGVPILFFFSGVHEDYHRVSDSPDKIDAEKESRVARLIFYLGLDIANARERPKWNPDSYRSIVVGN